MGNGGSSSDMGSAHEGMRKCFVLRSRGLCGSVGHGQVGSLQVGCCKTGDVVSNGCGEFRNGFLYMDRVVVIFRIVNFGYPEQGNVWFLLSSTRRNKTNLSKEMCATRSASTRASRSLYSNGTVSFS